MSGWFPPAEFWSATDNAVLLPPQSSLSRESIVGALAGNAYVVFQSSGSAGEARLVCHSRAGLLASARAVNAHLGAQNEDVWLCALPVHHVAGLGIYSRAFCSGSRVYDFEGKWDAARFAARCAACEASLVSLVPTQVFDLLQAGCRCPQALRAVLVGGGRLDPRIEAGARALGWPLQRTYGLSEAGSQVATQRGEHLIVLPHLEAAIGAGGCLKLRGDSMAHGYLSADGSGGWQFELCLDADGWFQTDDLVELDGRQLRFLARASSRVKVLGELVDIDALERALLQSVPAGWEVALIDVPDPRSENALVLAFSAALRRDELQPLIQAFNATVAGFERIARAVEIDAIQRGALGKIRRGELRNRVIEAEK